ncbi:MAG TPA: EcsC family protein [Rubricoccaceae bacterium]|jgi:hypothetical protein
MSTTTSVRRFVLDRLYPRALDGLPGLPPPTVLAAEVRMGDGDFDDHFDRLVRRHVAITTAAGFASGLGGWLTLPVVLPANLAGVALVQLHMVASVAALAGHDPAAPHVREQVLGCLIGIAPEDPARDADAETMDRVGLKLAEKGLKLVVSGALRTARWGATKVAEGVQSRVLRGIPLVGGVIGAVSDGYVTMQVARTARDTFQGGLPHHDFPPQSGDGLPSGVVVPSPGTPSVA